MKSFLVDQDGYYGEFGGAYVPEILHKCVEELKNRYLEVLESEEFKREFVWVVTYLGKITDGGWSPAADSAGTTHG